MSQVIIFGDIGTGKTLLAAIMAIHDTRKVLANFEIKIDRWSMLEPQMLNDIHEPTLVIIDEAYSWLESRMSGNSINRYLSYCLFQSRKRQVDFVLTAQLLSTLDLRFKNMADVYIVAERNRKGFVYTVMYPGRRGRKVLTMSLDTAAKYWDKYDTMELVNPIDDELLYKVTQDKSTVIPTIDVAVGELVKERPANEWTKGMVADYCMEKMMPNSYVELIYNRMKRKYRSEDET